MGSCGEGVRYGDAVRRKLWGCVYVITQNAAKSLCNIKQVKLSLCLTDEVLRREDVREQMDKSTFS
jgi:hypothetical protein